MAPVQTFSSSPIVAAKAPTATAHSPTTSKTAPATATAAPSSSSASSSASSSYSPSHGQIPPAQPGARPSIPAATSSASFTPRATGHAAAMLPTPTHPLPSDSNSPPAPQPGAVPMPPGAASAAASTSSTLPPPPKSGETLGPEHTGAAQPPTAPPAQLSYPPPTASHTSLRGTSAAIPSPYEVGGGGGGPVQLPGIAGADGGGFNRATDLSHPPGYQQDAQAAEFSSGQRAAHEAYVAQHSNRLISSGLGMGMGLGAGEGGGAGDAEGTTIWNTAKKWASAAGDTLAAAEGEVWKAVNKDHK